MKVSELGEFGLIDLLAEMVHAAKNEKSAAWRQLILGIGDDTAAWQGDGSVQLATVDALVQDVHFTLETTTFEELGWKSLAVNLSDIAAMGGIPRYALVSLALPGQTEVDDMVSLYRGMLKLAQRYEVAIIGGNMSNAPLVSIHITVLGNAGSRDELLTRSATRPGEKIAVTGYPGTAAAGLEMLAKRLTFEKKAADTLRKAFNVPEPRLAEGQLLAKHGVKAAIDISDGLLSDLRHICESSQVGARLEIERIPIHPTVSAKFGQKALEMALSGGEDYELLFTASNQTIDEVKGKATCPVTVIGEVTYKTGEITLADKEGKTLESSAGGWEHFARK